jgi:CRISPR-associated protein Cmr2
VSWSLSLVPVQAWIAEARRSRDLLAGSAILAWLMARLIRSLEAAGATDLEPRFAPEVLGAFDGSLSDVLQRERLAYGVPNHVKGRMPETAEAAARVLAGLEPELAAGWQSLREEVREVASRNAAELWRQVGADVLAAPCPFQLVWCVEPSADFAAVDRLFSATKRARIVAPHVGKPIPKCSQCGRREAAGPPVLADWRKYRQKLEALSEVQRGLRIEASETLCDVCTLKRLAGYLSPQAFASTSAVAARDWLFEVRRRDDLCALLEALDRATERVPGLEPSWADRAPLLFERTVRRELAAANRLEDPQREEALRLVEQRRQELAQGIRSQPTDERAASARLPSPTPPDYLAVVAFDGDDMGRWARELPQALSARVAKFQELVASQVDRENVDPAESVLASVQSFYLGGDEGLLLAPAGRVLELAAEIRSLWSEVVQEGQNEGPSLSVGVAIFDRERPLGPAILLAHQALVSSKQLDGKNGLCVSVATASGSRWSAVRGWQGGWGWARTATAALRAGRLARGWPHDVERFLRAVPGAAWEGDRDAHRAILEELRRITLRRIAPRRRAVDPEQGRRAAGEALWRELLDGGLGWEQVPSREAREALAEQLHVVAFLGGAGAGRGSLEVSDAA